MTCTKFYQKQEPLTPSTSLGSSAISRYLVTGAWWLGGKSPKPLFSSLPSRLKKVEAMGCNQYPPSMIRQQGLKLKARPGTSSVTKNLLHKQQRLVALGGSAIHYSNLAVKGRHQMGSGFSSMKLRGLQRSTRLGS